MAAIHTRLPTESASPISRQEVERRHYLWTRAALATMQSYGVDPLINSVHQFIWLSKRESIEAIRFVDTQIDSTEAMTLYQRDPRVVSHAEVATIIRDEYIRFCSCYFKRPRATTASDGRRSDAEFLHTSTIRQLGASRDVPSFPVLGTPVTYPDSPWTSRPLTWYFNTLIDTKKQLKDVISKHEDPSRCTENTEPDMKELVDVLLCTVESKMKSPATGVDMKLIRDLEHILKDCLLSVPLRVDASRGSGFGTDVRNALEAVIHDVDDANGATFEAATSVGQWSAASAYLDSVSDKHVIAAIKKEIVCHKPELTELIDFSAPIDQQSNFMPFVLWTTRLKTCCSRVIDVRVITKEFEWLLGEDADFESLDRAAICDRYTAAIERLKDRRHNNYPVVATCIENMKDEITGIAEKAWKRQEAVFEGIRLHNQRAREQSLELDRKTQDVVVIWQSTVKGLYEMARDTPIGMDELRGLALCAGHLPTQRPNPRMFDMLRGCIPANADLDVTSRFTFSDPVTASVRIFMCGSTGNDDDSPCLTEKQAADICLINALTS